MSKKILFMSSAKLTAICFGLLLAVFCTIGMSFRPVYSEDEKELVMSGPRRAHWVAESSGCTGTSYTYKNKTDYGKAVATVSGTGGTVSIAGSITNETQSVSGNNSTTATLTWNTALNSDGQKDLSVHTNSITLTANPASGYAFVGWYDKDDNFLSGKEEYAQPVTIPGGVYEKGTIKTEDAAKNKYGNWQSSDNPYTETFYAKFKEIEPVDLTFIAPIGGIYTVTINGVTTTVSSSDVIKTGVTQKVTLDATPSSGYIFAGWYMINGSGDFSDISAADPLSNKQFAESASIGARFVSTSTTPKFKNITTNTEYYGLKAAMVAASAGQTVIPVADCAVDGSDLAPGEPMRYTIPAGVTLLIPYSSANSVQATPAIVRTAATPTPYRTLTLTEGVEIQCNGNICIGGQIMSANGGNPSGYVTGPCGVIDMSRGGHIELNSGATLYAWGFIKGQDMDQGNNTVGVGTITANDGSNVWEDLAFGDWRGGSACLDIASTRFFPFQSYFVQNIEVPLTINYGATDNCYSVVYASSSSYPVGAKLIGNDGLFKTTSSASVVRKWYDPTTDLTCYELSGTANLDAITVSGLPMIGSISSASFDLPISSNMHIILTNSSVTLSKSMVLHPGAKVEIKNDANITIHSDANIYLYDKEDWGLYVVGKFFRSYGNLTIHKNRGDGTSKDLLDDAQFIVDGRLTVNGKLYSTTGGADIMGNGGGRVTFPSSLVTATNVTIDAFTGNGDKVSGGVSVKQANLCNEDKSYTKAIASKTFLNINGRWFNQTDGASTIKGDHTYDFTYISSGAVSGTGGTNTTTDAVYSNDKTGLEARMKWFNVTADDCANWWHGQGEQATWFYNWTLESAWHQFMPTSTVGLYSSSNNTLYTKTDCVWKEFGDADVNCLYEIGGIKKALVDGQFIALEPNNNDPAYHAADDETKYYICFEGCNWHEADKYEEVQKAYIIEPDTFIWYNNAWMSVNFKQPFAYTLDETNVPIYYEYLDGEWVLAEPYVRVVDGSEDRPYWFLADAFKFASSVLRTAPTITILRDISGITTAVSYTGTKTCTLDLNGCTITGSVSSMLTINGAGCTFYIVDNNTEGKEGKINLYYSANTRRYAVNVTKGHLKLQSGTISATNTMIYKSGQTSTTSCAIIVKASQQCTIEGGKVYAQADHNPFGIYGDGNSSTITVKGGEVIASVGAQSEPRGIQVTGGTLNVQGDAVIEATTYAGGTTGEGILVNQNASYHATLNMTGGTVKATTKTSSIGVYVNCSYTCDSNEPRSITAWSRAEAYISGGEIRAENKNGGTAEGVRSLGTTEISGGKIIVRPTTTTAIGVRLYDGTTTIKGSADIDVAATSTAYGVRISEEQPANKSGIVYNGTLNMTGGTLTVRTTGTTDAYGVYVGAHTRAMTTTHASNSSYYAGNYANAGTANISGGVIDVQAKTNKAYSIYVENPVSESGATGYETATATPNCSITGGKFKVASMTANATNIAATNVSTSTYTISGGYYNNQENVAGYTTAPKHVITLPTTDANYPEYLYKVANSYLVTFMNGSETLQSTYQEEGKVPTYTEAEPTKASTGGFSYAFNGWSTSSNNTPAALTAVTSAGATYYACFEQTDLRYTISLNANGGECAQEYIRVIPGAAAGTLPSATKVGHTFKGWFTATTGGTQLTASTIVSGDITYYAQFTVNNYTLTYELGEGKVSTAGSPIPAKKATGTQSQSVAYGTAITAPVVSRTGYTFKSWDAIVAATMPAEDVTYTPLWIPNVNTAYSVKHYLQNVDGTYPADPVETQSLTGTTATSVTPAVKSYDGFVSPATQTVTIAAAGTTVVEYQYARRHYTFTLDAYTNGGTSEVPSIEVIHGATIGAVPPDAQKGCNDFTGWYTQPVGGVKITSEFVIEYDMKKLYAQFSDDVRTYPITYLAGANGTGTVDAGTKTCGEDATLSSSTFTRDHYTQTGWSTEDGGAKAYDLGGAYTANAALTLYPFWTINTHALAWNFNGGSTSSTTHTADNNALAYGSAISYPLNNTMTKTGYTFAGWSSSATTMPDEDLTITANWTPKQYTITFDSKGGSAVASITQGYTSAITAPADPTREGYTFNEWSPAVPSTMPLNGLTCVAQWTPNTNTPYVVKHYQQNLDGTYPSEPTDTDNETGTTDTEVTPEVKIYTGFTAPDAQTVTVLPDGSRVVTYQYTRKSYNLTWDANGGELSGEYTSGLVKFGAPIAAPTATRTNYDFDGWDEEPAATMPAENKTYTAQWSLAAVTILWKSEDGADIIETDDLVAIGSTPSFDSDGPTKATTEAYTYTFDGWTTEANGAGTFYAIGELPEVTAAATYYAHFSATANVASVKVGNAASTYYTTIDDAFAYVNTVSANMTITLLQDAPAAASLVYQPTSTYTCTLDLNNHTISGTFTKVINVNLKNAVLTITDNSTEKGGKIKTEQSLNGKLYGLFITAGKVNLNAGTIECINTLQYNSSSAANVAAYGVYVYSSNARYFTMTGGTVKANATYNVFGVYSAGTTKLEGGKIIVSDAVTGLTKNGTGYGVYVAGATTTISKSADISVNTKTVAYGVYVKAGTTNATGGVILAKTSSSTKAYGVHVNGGTFNAPEGSTTSITANAYSTTAYAIGTGANGTANIYDGTYEAKAPTSTGTTTYGVYSSGTTNIHGGTFTVSAKTSTARAIGVWRNTTTVDGNPVFNVSAPTIVYGATASGTTPKASTAGDCGTLKVYGGTFNVEATKTTTAYGVYAYPTSGYSQTTTGGTIEQGNYINAGTVEVHGGTFNVKAKTTDAYGVFVNNGTQTNAEAGDPKTAYGKCTITDGQFKVETTGDANATAYAINTVATEENLTVQGGQYSTKRTNASATSVIEDKYTAPTKDCNYRVLPLEDETYKYEVAEAYEVTFKNGTTTLQDTYIKKGTTPAYAGEEPTETATDEYTYTFDGWSDTEDGAVVNPLPDVSAAATYYAHFSSTPNLYTLTWDVNGGDDLTGDYTYGSTAYGTTIVKPADPTKTGYTFADWTPSVATTMPAANTTYTATWTPSTNTPYVVKHYKENLDGTYSSEPDETDNLTGTTDAEVTPAVKSYTGFTAPSTQTVTILADGSRVVEYYYTRNSHKVTWDATTNGGSCETAYSMVKHGATIGTLPEATKTGHDFQGWFTAYTGGGNQVTASTVINFATTAYARFAPSTYTITYKDQGDSEFSGVQGSGYPTTHTYGTATVLVSPTKAGYTFDGWYDNAACTGSALTEIGATAYTADFILYAKWTIKSNCTIRWENYDGTLLCESTIQRIGTPSYPNHGPVPKKPGDANRTYTFIGWSPEIHAANGDETYTAQYSMSITTGEPGTYTVSGTEDAVATTVQVSGALHIPEDNSLTTGDLILEASAGESGTIDGIERVTVTGDAYFDYKFDVDPWHWSAFGVPFEIDLDDAAPLKEKTSPLGIVGPDDYDIVYYDTEERAAHGASKNCWKYVDNETHRRLIPGRLYMIAFDKHVGHVGVLRFKKAASAPVNCTTSVSLITTGPAGGNNNWNGIANPMMYHALLGAGVTECQVHDGGEIGKDGYYTYDMNNRKFYVGKAAFVQVPNNQAPIVVTQATDENPIVKYVPRRTKASVATENRYDIQIAPSNEAAEDRLLILAEEDKADEYVIVSDLAKAGVSPVRAQVWIDRYGEKLCKNTTAFINNKADYPLVISTPKAGEYDLFINEQPDDETMLYLTYDGNAIWNLSYGGYVAHLEKGTTTHYGLRIVRTPKVSTGIEETTIQNGEAIRKVIVDDKVYIIRNNEIYSITGQKAQ